MRSAVKMKVGRGSDWTELMEYFGEQKGKELSLSTVASLRTGRFCCCCYQVASVVSDSVRPHRWQPTSLPWDSPGKNTGVGCHFFLQCMRVKSESEVTLSCQTLCDMDCSLPGSSPWDFPGKSTGVDCHLRKVKINPATGVHR